MITYPTNKLQKVLLAGKCQQGVLPDGYKGHTDKVNGQLVNDDTYNWVRDTNNNLVFPDGMKSAGSVYDEIVYEDGTLKAIKRIGSVDLGVYSNAFELVPGKDTTKYYLAKDLDLSIPTTFPSNAKNNIICSEYDIIGYSSIWAGVTSNCIAVFRTSKNEPAIALSADVNINNLTGVTLYYELATPVEYTLSDVKILPTPDEPIDIVCNNGVVKVRHQSGLPLGYTRVEYLESTGTQWINTQTVVRSVEYIKAKIMRTDNTSISSWQTFIGCTATNNDQRCVFGGSVTANYFGYRWHTTGSTVIPEPYIEFNLNTEYTLEVNGNIIQFNNNRTNISNSNENSDRALYLFSQGANSNVFRGRFYYAQLGSDKDTLVRNLIPARRDSDNVLGMYDTVTGDFLTNAGTGTFTAGNTVSDPIEIYTDGTIEQVTDNLGNTANAEMLLGVGDYKDVQSVLDGKVARRVGIKVLDGTEDWNKGTSFYTNSDIVSDALQDTHTVLCTHYQGISTDATVVADSNTCKIGSDVTAEVHWGRIYIYADRSLYATGQDFANYLAQQYANGTPVIIVYPLATPTTEQVTPQPLAGNSVTQTAGSIDNLPIESSTIAELKKRYIGDKEVKRVYIGDNLVWEKLNN